MSFAPLTGRWQLNLDKSDSQRDFLKLWGRPSWQYDVIDKADEDFFIVHFVILVGDRDIHCFHKDVHIYLKSNALKFASALTSWITGKKFDQVQYKHNLKATGREQKHPDDEKRFGPCSSVSVIEDGCFILRWRITKGLIVVKHFIDESDGRLNAQMTFTAVSGKSETSTKRYDRIPFTKDNKEYMATHKKSKFIWTT